MKFTLNFNNFIKMENKHNMNYKNFSAEFIHNVEKMVLI